MLSLGKQIKLARTSKGWQQQRLAHEAHISQKYLSQIEHDHVDPRWSILVKLAHALDPELVLDPVIWDTPRAPQKVTP